MLERLKQPFWFGLPLYAWVAGGAALALGLGYFAFFARAQAAATTPQTDTSGGSPLNPYPSTDPGAGATVPPATSFDPAGAVVYTQPSPAYLTPSDPVYIPTAAVTSGTVGPSSRIVAQPASPAGAGVVAVGGYVQQSIGRLIAALPGISRSAPAPAPFALSAPTPSASGRSL
jgi:hypothetical protein